MDHTLLQVNRVHLDSPNLLCQYTYFLNRDASKTIILGFDTNTFAPTIQILSFVNNKKISFTIDEWNCVLTYLNHCFQYLQGQTETAWCKKSSLIIDSTCRDGERFIRFSNYESSSNTIELNIDEFKVLSDFSPFLTRILKHYSDNYFEVEKYYRQYVLKCIVYNTKSLDYSEYFFPPNRGVLNYLRLFSELPILSRYKLDADLTV